MKKTKYLYGVGAEKIKDFLEPLIKRYEYSLYLLHLLVWKGKGDKRIEAVRKANEWAKNLILEIEPNFRFKSLREVEKSLPCYIKKEIERSAGVS